MPRSTPGSAPVGPRGWVSGGGDERLWVRTCPSWSWMHGGMPLGLRRCSSPGETWWGAGAPCGPRCSHLTTRPGDSRDTFRRGGHYGKLRQNLYMLGQLSVTAQGRGGGTGGSWPHAERAAYLPDHPPVPPPVCLPVYHSIHSSNTCGLSQAQGWGTWDPCPWRPEAG